jgi:hypothetical protein
MPANLSRMPGEARVKGFIRMRTSRNYCPKPVTQPGQIVAKLDGSQAQLLPLIAAPELW